MGSGEGEVEKGAGPVGSTLAQIPEPAERHLALRITPAAERALRGGHAWLFESAIRQQSHEGSPGDLAVVFDRKDRFLAVGLYDPLSSIRVRVLAHGEPVPIDEDWFRGQLAAAARLRAPLLEQPPEAATTGYRLVYGENDGLPGLVIDRYEDTAVFKLYTPAWIPHLRYVLPALERARWVERVVLRLGRAVRRAPDRLFGLRDGTVLRGPPLDGPVLFSENGLRFEADPVRGQKTGFFLDQRENRARVERLAGGAAVPATWSASMPVNPPCRPRPGAGRTTGTSPPWRQHLTRSWSRMLSRHWRAWRERAAALTWSSSIPPRLRSDRHRCPRP